MYSFPFQNTCIQTFVYMPVMISQSCSVLNYENNLKSDLTIQTSTYFQKKKKTDFNLISNDLWMNLGSGLFVFWTFCMIIPLYHLKYDINAMVIIQYRLTLW